MNNSTVISVLGAFIVLLLIIGSVTMDIDMHPVLSESVVDSVQWMGGFIVTAADALTE